jgi:NADH-quinone oxidoreductase subunit H
METLFWLFNIQEPNSIHVILAGAVTAGVAIGCIAVVALVTVWLERKISAYMQCRVGPMEVGWQGILQTAADGLKLFLKEDIIPAMADRWLFIIGPFLVFAGALMSWAVLPIAPFWVPTDLNIAVAYLLATSSFVAIGIIMSGWASHNKWSIYSTMRTAAQFLSYEVPTALHLIPPIIVAGSLSLVTIVNEQESGFLGVGGWFIWNPFCFLSFIAYYVSSLAEVGRTPFDLPESESELVAGFHTEYSGMRFAFFFMAEYADLFVVCAIGALLFLGGWNGPFFSGGIIGTFLYLFKVLLLIFLAMWLRWTLPRLRIDQVMSTCWKFLIPLGLINILGASLWMVLTGQVR